MEGGLRSPSRLSVRLALVGLVACVLRAATPGAAQTSTAGSYKDGELLVGVARGASLQATQAIHAQVGATVIRHWPSIGVDHVKLPAGLPVAAAIAQYQKLPGVRYASPNYLRHVCGSPNDPLYPSQWDLPKISADLAWQVGTGSRAVVLADIDSGVDYTHEDLAANMWTNPGETPGDGIDNDGNGYVDDVHGMNAVTGSGDPMDDNGHGTHTSGTMGAVGNNGLDVTGVNWRVQIMACKCLNRFGNGTDAAEIACFQYVTDMKLHHHVNVVATNSSWGGPGFDQALKDAIDACGDAGIVNCCSAGNGGDDLVGDDDDVTPCYPASFDSPSIIAVAASDQADHRAVFSNFGQTTVDLAAPGVAILSTVPGNATDSWPGTSMATPHVTGAVGLVRAVRGAMSVAAMKRLILNSVDHLPQWTSLCVSGGRLNLAAAVDALPIISRCDLTPACRGPSADTTVTLWFNQPMKMKTVPSAFTLTGSSGTVAGSWTWPSSQQGVFRPSHRLAWQTTYTVKVTTAATNSHGAPLDGNINGHADGSPADDYTFAFTTGVPPPPAVTLVAPRDGEQVAGNAYRCAAKVVPDLGATVSAVQLQYATTTRTDTYTTAPAMSIPAGATTANGLSVPDHWSPTKVRVYVNITIAHRGDLALALTSPRGVTIRLKDPCPYEGDVNLVDWFPGSFGEPVDPLSNLWGTDTFGPWTLTVAVGGFNAATLNEWRLEFTSGSWNTIGTNAAGPVGGYWQLPWDTTALPAGAVSVRAVCQDNFGSVGQSQATGVVLDQGNSLVAIAQPSEDAHLHGRHVCKALATPPAGDTMRSVTFSRLTDATASYASSPGAPIEYGGLLTWDYLNCTASGRLVGIQVAMDVSMDPTGLVLMLVSPTGTRVRLHDEEWTGLVGTYPVDLTPSRSLGSFLGEGVNGTWSLAAWDTGGVGSGTLNSWGLTLVYETWATIGTATRHDPAGYWNVPWSTTAIPDQPTLLRATALTAAGKTGTDTHGVTIDNTAPTITNVSDSPDPFTTRTTISYDLSEPCQAAVRIYSDAGRTHLVKQFSGSKPTGTNRATWNGTDSSGGAAPPGTYYYQVTASDAAGNAATPVTGNVTKSG